MQLGFIARCLSGMLAISKLKTASIILLCYAKILGARFSVIASKENVWITAFGDDYDRCVFEEIWKSLSDTDVFYRLQKLTGKRQIMCSINKKNSRSFLGSISQVL